MRAFLDALSAEGAERPSAVVYTHSHWDQVFGGAGLGGQVIAHGSTAEQLIELAPRDWSDEGLDRRVAAGMIPCDTLRSRKNRRTRVPAPRRDSRVRRQGLCPGARRVRPLTFGHRGPGREMRAAEKSVRVGGSASQCPTRTLTYFIQAFEQVRCATVVIAPDPRCAQVLDKPASTGALERALSCALALGRVPGPGGWLFPLRWGVSSEWLATPARPDPTAPESTPPRSLPRTLNRPGGFSLAVRACRAASKTRPLSEPRLEPIQPRPDLP